MSTVAEQRIIGHWTIGETLSREKGYSWTKRGEDIKTGKAVSLKFIQKSDISFTKEQLQRIERELEALTNVRHLNAMKLYSYHLNAAYPVRKFYYNDTQKYVDTILLIQEYTPGQRELFDLLYYTNHFNEKIARTFFKQIINGLEAYHNNGIVHGQLKLESLALDKYLNIKIINSGLFKNIQSAFNTLTAATCVGECCYIAPEILLNIKYDLKCDIFSVGVILFILLTGNPPFEMASKSDPWYKQLIKGNIDKFWKAFQTKSIAKMSEVKDLLTKMLCFDATQRIDLNGIKNHEWFKGETLKNNQLLIEVGDRYSKSEKRRRIAVRHLADYADIETNNRCKSIYSSLTLRLFPEDLSESLCDVYTFTSGYFRWYDIYSLIENVIHEKHGETRFDSDKQTLICVMLTAQTVNEKQRGHTVKFGVDVFESRKWKNRYLEVDESDDIREKNEDQILVVTINRIEGDSIIFNEIKNDCLLTYCSSILMGLPKWAGNMNDRLQNKLQNERLRSINMFDDEYHGIDEEHDWKQQMEITQSKEVLDIEMHPMIFSKTFVTHDIENDFKNDIENDQYDKRMKEIESTNWKNKTKSDPNLQTSDISLYPVADYETFQFWNKLREKLQSKQMNQNNIQCIMQFLERNNYKLKHIIHDISFDKASKSRFVQFFVNTFNRKAMQTFNILYSVLLQMKDESNWKNVENKANKWWLEVNTIDLLINGFIRRTSIDNTINITNNILILCSNFYGYLL